MDETEGKSTRKRTQHLRVPVFPEEKALIESLANKAGLSVARYLRDIGQGYEIKGITDYGQVRELARINGDLGRLGGLLKLWLTDDVRTAKFGESTILALLGRIQETQNQMSDVMTRIVMPRSKF
ncbi:conjugal transfer transcriptional regulator TraJ [Alcaligenes aquatilis]|uniref:conjugal transfer transcriptional regulator TraJ n=1 Tax=Alcaligenes aquatilis TaxID=323284 RepID=UPI003608ECA0